MAGQDPLSLIRANSATFAEAYGERNYYELPTSWNELNVFLTRLNSGAMGDGIAGIAAAPSDNETSEKKAKERREKEQDALYALSAINESMDNIRELAKEIQKAFDNLLRIDRKNAARLQFVEDMQKKLLQLHIDIDKTELAIKNLDSLRIQNENLVKNTIGSGLISKNPLEYAAASLIQERSDAEKNLITVTYRVGSEFGVMPQHIVFCDSKGEMYIKDALGMPLYLKDLQLSASERKKMDEDIERQRNGTEYKPGKEKFGNEDPASAAQYERSNAALQREALNGNTHILVYDQYIADGRSFRKELYINLKELKDLLKEKQQIEEKIRLSEKEICESGNSEGRKYYEELKEKKILMEQKQIELQQKIDKTYSTLAERNEAMKKMATYLTSGTYDEKTFISNIPDQALKANVQMRIDELKKQQEQLNAQKEIAARQEKNVATAEVEIKGLRGSNAIYSTSIKRKDWLNHDTNAEFVRDKNGNVVSYDLVKGYFYIEKPGAGRSYFLTDPTATVGFLKQAWEDHKQLGNEKELGNMTIASHMSDVNLIIGTRRLTVQTIMGSLDMQQVRINSEMAQISNATASDSSGPRVTENNTNKPAASGIDPLSQETNYSQAFTGLAGRGIQIEPPAAGPDTATPSEKVKMGGISMTSDGKRGQ